MDQAKPELYEFEGYRIDAGKRLLFDENGEVIPLMPKAFDTLVYLVANAGRVIDKDELFREVWPDTIVEENNLTQNISILRKAFGEKPGQHRFIATVPGTGYKFVASVSAPGDEPDAGVLAVSEQPSEGGRPVRRNWLMALGLIVAISLGTLAFLFSKDRASSEETVRAIAVLPFKPLSVEDRNESLELGMADSLITRLGGSETLIVRPLFSVRRFTSPDEDPLAAGRALDVQAVLDGTIQMSEKQVRVSARLLRVPDGRQIWAEQFDEDRTNLFKVQDSIANRVAAALDIRLGARSGQGTDNFQAYESYMLGRLHSMRLVMPEVKKGISYYEQAISADPTYALAYVGIAEAQRALVMSNDLDPQIAFVQAKSAASRAVELNPNISQTHVALGTIAFFYDWEWELAEEHLRRAIAINPNDSEPRIHYAHLLSNLGRHDEALAEARRARELDPVSPVIRSLEGLFYEQSGDADSAIARLEKTVEINREFWLPHHLLASAYIRKGRNQDAIAESNEAKRLAPFQTHSLAFRGVAHVRAGDPDETRRILEDLLKASRERYVPPCHIAMLYAALGENQKALDYLERGYKEKDVRMIFLKVDEKWEGLRSEPRFVELMRLMRF